jgi:hypothetical protein
LGFVMHRVKARRAEFGSAAAATLADDCETGADWAYGDFFSLALTVLHVRVQLEHCPRAKRNVCCLAAPPSLQKQRPTKVKTDAHTDGLCRRGVGRSMPQGGWVIMMMPVRPGRVGIECGYRAWSVEQSHIFEPPFGHPGNNALFHFCV